MVEAFALTDRRATTATRFLLPRTRKRIRNTQLLRLSNGCVAGSIGSWSLKSAPIWRRLGSFLLTADGEVGRIPVQLRIPRPHTTRGGGVCMANRVD